MKSKKIMGLLLAGSIFVGATAYGTKAWFTDTATTDANLTVTMGYLDIELDELDKDDQWWVKEGTETNEENGDWGFDWENGTNYFTNVRPGDTFTRSIPVRNEGTLGAKVDIALADTSNVVVGKDINGQNILFDEVFEFKTTSTGTVEILSDEVIEIDFELKVKEDLGNKANANNGKRKIIKFNLNKAFETEFITVTANQLNNENNK